MHITSTDDASSLRAIKLTLDLAARPPAPMCAPKELDRSLAADERQTARLIAEIGGRLDDEVDHD
jgi:hypothetical protein